MKQKEVLRFGLNHLMLLKKLKIDEFKVDLERCTYSIKRKKFILIDDEFKDNLKYLCTKFADGAKRAYSSRNSVALRSCLNSLSKDRSLKI